MRAYARFVTAYIRIGVIHSLVPETKALCLLISAATQAKLTVLVALLSKGKFNQKKVSKVIWAFLLAALEEDSASLSQSQCIKGCPSMDTFTDQVLCLLSLHPKDPWLHISANQFTKICAALRYGVRAVEIIKASQSESGREYVPSCKSLSCNCYY